MASTPASLPSLGLLDGLGQEVTPAADSPAYLPSIGLLGGLGTAVGGGPTYTLVCEHGTVSVLGSDAYRDFSLTVEHGTVTLGGQDATLTPGDTGPTYTLECEAGSVSLAGQDATFRRSYVLQAEAGRVTIGGQNATLDYSGIEEPTEQVPRRSAAGGRRNYIIKGRKYYNVTNEELAYLIARNLIDVSREDVKVKYKNRQKPVGKNAWESLQETIKSLGPTQQFDDEEEAAMLLL